MNWDFRKKENLHIVFWLVKDFCWLTSEKFILAKYLGVAMALPTILLSIYLTWLSRKLKAELFHNLAVTSWIHGNAIWMIGEFYFNDKTRHIAFPFFLIGIGFLLYFYISEFIISKKNNAI